MRPPARHRSSGPGRLAVQGGLRAGPRVGEISGRDTERLRDHDQQTRVAVLKTQFAGSAGQRIRDRRIAAERRDAQVSVAGMTGVHAAGSVPVETTGIPLAEVLRMPRYWLMVATFFLIGFAVHAVLLAVAALLLRFPPLPTTPAMTAKTAEDAR